MAGAIVAMGGGGFSMEPDNPLLDEYVLAQARQARPRVCFVATASGDAPGYVADFYWVFSRLDCRPSDLGLFSRTVTDLRSFVLDQDVVYVGGGSTANLLAVWRAHGLPAILSEAHRGGTVLAGISAGMNCWFEASVTDSFDVASLAPLRDGLGLVAGIACPHYDSEGLRQPAYLDYIRSGELPPGLAADDGAALVFDDAGLREVVTSRRHARAFRVGPGDAGVAIETELATRFLG